MIVKLINECDFVNYKKISMFIIFSRCSFKCDDLNGCRICLNSALANEPNIEISSEEIYNRYVNNPMTNSFVFGGLEPFDTPADLIDLVRYVREQNCHDDIVIYTGYYKDELKSMPVWEKLIKYDNIIIKYGRFIKDLAPHYDETLGVNLTSDNQYGERL